MTAFTSEAIHRLGVDLDAAQATLTELARLWGERVAAARASMSGDPTSRHLRAQVRVGPDLAAALDALCGPGPSPPASA